MREPCQTGKWVKQSMKRLGSIWTAKGALLAATALVMSPAIAAGFITTMPKASTASIETSMGRFTPVSGDPQLIKQLAQISQSSRSNFRFTPAMASKESDNRALTVVVRAPGAPSAISRHIGGALSPTLGGPGDAKPVSIAPVAYNLGAKIGMDRFAVTDRTKLDLAAMPKVKPVSAPAGRPSRIDTVMRVDSVENAATDRPLDGDRTVEVDLATSYKLTRNLKVTAGVRYKQDNDRLQPMTDTRRDSQAVYVGTQVRF